MQTYKGRQTNAQTKTDRQAHSTQRISQGLPTALWRLPRLLRGPSQSWNRRKQPKLKQRSQYPVSRPLHPRSHCSARPDAHSHAQTDIQTRKMRAKTQTCRQRQTDIQTQTCRQKQTDTNTGTYIVIWTLPLAASPHAQTPKWMKNPQNDKTHKNACRNDKTHNFLPKLNEIHAETAKHFTFYQIEGNSDSADVCGRCINKKSLRCWKVWPTLICCIFCVFYRVFLVSYFLPQATHTHKLQIATNMTAAPSATIALASRSFTVSASDCKRSRG